MIEGIKDWIINIVTVIILISFLELLMPDGKMKKYLNLMFGFIIMLVILGPVIDILNRNNDLENEVFKISSELSKKEYSFISTNIENKQMDQLASLYKDRIEKDIVYRVENKYDVKVIAVNIEIEDAAQGKLGEIKKLELSVSHEEEKPKEDAIPIVKIDVSNSEKNESLQNNNNSPDNDINIGLREKIKEDISNIYNLNEESVVINN